MRWKGLISIALPLVAVLISSSFALFGNQTRQSIETNIQRKFALVNNFNEVLTLMVNAETGMRGFQLTKRDEFLQPYQLAQDTLPNKLNALQSLIEAEPGEKPRIRKMEIFNQMKGLIQMQINDLAWQKEHLIKQNGFDDELYNHINAGKNYMDKIRNLLGQMQSEESERLTERISEINQIRQRDYFVVFLTLFIALVTRFVSWYLMRKGIHQRVGRMLKKLKANRQTDGVEIDEAGEMETLEAEVDYLLAKQAKQ